MVVMNGMRRKWVTVPALALAVCGCTTHLPDRRAREMRERADLERLRTQVERLEERVRGLEAVRQELDSEVRGLRRESERQHTLTAERLADVQREIEAARAAREQLRSSIVDQLSRRVSELMAAQPTPQGTAAQRGYEHVVQPGETLSHIAATYGATVEAITRANNLRNPDAIRVGQTLFIPE